MKEITLRTIRLNDLEAYYEFNKPGQKFHDYNGPYFKKDTEEELKIKMQKLKADIEKGQLPKQKRLIVDKEHDCLIGEVSWYWKSEETKWMEIGIVIFDEAYWGYGIGYSALKLWVDEMFDTFPDLVRLGLTTWSGNDGMMKLAEKMGFKCEATYRKARIVNGQYYDSVSYGILREEWFSDVHHKRGSREI